jgi:hypothetical protein
MSTRTFRTMLRCVCAAAVAVVVAWAGFAATASSQHSGVPSGHHGALARAGGRDGHDPAGHTGQAPSGMRPASVNPRGALGRILTRAQASAAAQTCVRFGTAAGWANNAQNGSLVTASAICVAESGGQPTVYYCNTSGHDGYYPPVTCSGAYDRGLWQIDNQAWTSISDACAFSSRCNADGAYVISRGGQSFTPWATYTSGAYSNYLADAQAAVGSLHVGTIPAGIPGVCLSRVKYAQGANAVTAACGSGTRRQQWGISGQAIQDGRYCLAVASAARNARVVLSTCNSSSAQQWAAQGNGELRNAESGRCLRDPGASTTVGTPVDVGSCTVAVSRLWWLP